MDSWNEENWRTGMKAFFDLLRPYWIRVALAMLLGVVSGACNAGLLGIINSVVNNAGSSQTLLIWCVLALAIVKVISGGASQVTLTMFAQATMLNLRRSLCRRILATPLRKLEQVGPFRLLAALTEDTMAIRMFLSSIPQLTVDIAILLGCLVYLTWLSWSASLFLLVILIIGIGVYRILMAKAWNALRRVREIQDTLFGHYRGLTEGVKELQTHKNRRKAFFSRNIDPTTEAFRKHSVVSMTHFIVANSWSQLVMFLVVGAVLIFLPTLDNFSKQTLTGYVITILYLMSPMRELLHIIPTFGRADIALKRIGKLGLSLDSQASEANSGAEPVPERSWKALHLEDVFFTYRQDGRDANFTLGPIDFAVRPGEIVFVVGGNGAGKSTLAKLLVGLYPPEHGSIELKGQNITDENREWYRQHFSVVFSDFYVFDDLFGLESANLDQRAGDYLSLLQLTEKVQVTNGSLSTTALSQGQRRRLALLTAYLEDRPIYVFDEWAADQDPQYKNVFYTQLLPDLKAAGKAVIVITHDDRYFDLADRIFKLDYGKAVTSGMDSARPRSHNIRLAAVEGRHNAPEKAGIKR